MALLMDFHMQSIDFIIAFNPTPINADIYMSPPKVPKVFKIPYLKHPSFVFTKNLYGLKDTGSTWFDFFKYVLINRGCGQSTIDNCLFKKSSIIIIVYVDDSILLSPSKVKIRYETKSL